MAKKWYVVHTFSGYEQKAKAALEERIKTLGKQEYFGEILVPVEKVVELVKGKRKPLRGSSSRGTSWCKWSSTRKRGMSSKRLPK